MNYQECANYQECVNYIEEIPKFTTKNPPEHTRDLLCRLGNPEKGIHVIHVAGTNGKGSTCAYLNAMLMEGGYRTGLFTSPHLEKINERFKINNEDISDEVFTKAFQRVMEVVNQVTGQGGDHPSYFEFLFLMGMVIFREAGVDYLILETGLGGRLDATNVIERPLACIITSISRDHTAYLGETIPEIASEKAGIIKAGVPVIYDAHDAEAARVMAETAAKKGSPAYALEPSMYHLISNTRAGITFGFAYQGEAETQISVPFVAEYQMMNASLAFFTMKKLAEVHQISEEKLISGIQNVSWPCRMETVLPGVIIDGAHNEDGVAQFIKTAAHFARENEITILFTAVSDKRYYDMIREIVEGIHPEHIVATSVWGPRAVPAEELAEDFRKQGVEDVLAESNSGKAFDLAYAKKGEGMLFCVGSLYLAGEIKTHIKNYYC